MTAYGGQSFEGGEGPVILGPFSERLQVMELGLVAEGDVITDLVEWFDMTGPEDAYDEKGRHADKYLQTSTKGSPTGTPSQHLSTGGLGGTGAWDFAPTSDNDFEALTALVADRSFFAIDGSMSIAAWLRADTLPGRDMVPIGNYQNTSTCDFRFNINNAPNGQIELEVADGAGLQASNGPTLSTGVWYFLAVEIREGTDMRLSVTPSTDGSLAAFTSPTSLGTISNTARDLHIGGQVNGTRSFDGRVSQLTFWDRILASADWDRMFNAGAGTTYATETAAVTSEVQLLDARLFKSLGHHFTLVNQAASAVVVKDANDDAVGTLTQDTSGMLVLLDNSTAKGDWRLLS